MNRRQVLLGALGVLGLGNPFPLLARDAELGRPAPPFRVRDTREREWQLVELAGKPVILEWTSPSCPFARAQYQSGVMQELQRMASAQGAVWLSVISIHPTRGDFVPADKAEALHLQRGAASAALLMDSEGTLGHAYGAVVTPQFFIVDGKGILVYAGGPHAQPTRDPAEVRSLPNLIRAALEDLRAGRPVATPASPPFGCAISYRG